MKIEIDVGKTVHGQAVQVVARRAGPRDPWVFEVVKLPAGQRDDEVTLFALPAEVLKAIGKAAADVELLQL